jgi:tetratricopeptide (TPR) repeat protein
MKKRHSIVVFLILIFSCVCAYANEAETEQAAGFALLKADNQWKKAVPHLKKAVLLDSKLYLAWYNLGVIYVSNVDAEEGFGYFQKSVEANPDFSTAYYWMAYCRCRNREDKQAIPLFEKYLEVAKGNKKESSRVRVAEEVLKDLRAGTEGKTLKLMRKPTGKDQS